MIKEVRYVAKDGTVFEEEQDCIDYEKSKITNITKEMCNELNQKLKEQGCVFEFQFEKRYVHHNNPAVGAIRAEFINKKFLDFNASINLLGDDGFEFMRSFLKTKGVKSISSLGGGWWIANQEWW